MPPNLLFRLKRYIKKSINQVNYVDNWQENQINIGITKYNEKHTYICTILNNIEIGCAVLHTIGYSNRGNVRTAEILKGNIIVNGKTYQASYKSIFNTILYFGLQNNLYIEDSTMSFHINSKFDEKTGFDLYQQNNYIFDKINCKTYQICLDKYIKPCLYQTEPCVYGVLLNDEKKFVRHSKDINIFNTTISYQLLFNSVYSIVLLYYKNITCNMPVCFSRLYRKYNRIYKLHIKDKYYLRDWNYVPKPVPKGYQCIIQ